MLAYWHPTVTPSEAKAHPAFARLQYAGPWWYSSHPQGGTLATWKDWPQSATNRDDWPRTPDAYGPAQDLPDEDLRYLPPRVLPQLYDLACSDRAGVELRLACGLVITVPEALTSQRALALTKRARARPPTTEYGRLAYELFDAAKAAAPKGLDLADPRLHRLVCLAVGARYRSTPELLDDLGVISLEDVDPILGAAWCGDPKALQAAPAAAAWPSPASDCTESTAPPPRPTPSPSGPPSTGVPPAGSSETLA